MPRPARLAVVAVLAVIGCKSKSSPSAGSAGSAVASSAVPADADVPVDAADPASLGPDPAKLAEPTAYVVKLRMIPKAIRAAKKVPAKCAPDMLATVPEDQRKAVAINYDDLQDLADEEVNYNIDPTFLMMNFQSRDATVLADVNKTERGKKHGYIVGFDNVSKVMTPFVLVTKADKLEHPQLSDGNKYWPGTFRGSVYVVDAATAKVLCGGKLAFASPAKLEARIEAKTAITHDFLTRGRKAAEAIVAKAAPGLQIVPWRDLTPVR